MTMISSAGSNLLDRIAASRTAAAPRTYTPAARADTAPTRDTTRVTLDTSAPADVVYAKPRSTFQQVRAWSAPAQKDDAVAALMAQRMDNKSYVLADQWRGLGGVLLSRFATTQDNYKQTVADYMAATDDVEPLDAAEAAARTAAAQALDTQALGGMGEASATVSLKIQTRSGQSVELKIATRDAFGLQVEVTSSGTLSDAERKALSGLAQGLDKALEGLGRQDAAKLDLSGLTGYDSSVLSSLDLTVQTPTTGTALGSFSLHLGADRKTVSLKSVTGEMTMNVDVTTPLGGASAAQRRNAIDQSLKKFDAAAQRGHADAALVEQMKDAFKQMHAAPEDSANAASGDDTTPSIKSSKADLVVNLRAASGADGVTPELAEQMQPLLSGLADFQASFSGDFMKPNQYGAAKEAGHADYALSQRTTTRADGATGGPSVAQTVSEQLDSSYKRSLNGGMLDVRTGNYSSHQVKDRSTVTTLIDSADHRISRALRKTEQQQLQTDDVMLNHRRQDADHRETPMNRQFAERLR